MDRDLPNSVAVSALRAVGLSPDGSEIIISLSVRYSTAERKYSVPVECFYDLAVDLRRLNATAKPERVFPGTAAFASEAAE